ncbi:MAG: HNH endonuclease [Pseudomonadota bacterium]|nr:HNH endonuclease [Pseudomonadota bacterium]
MNFFKDTGFVNPGDSGSLADYLKKLIPKERDISDFRPEFYCIPKGGSWVGGKGESTWRPDLDKIPNGGRGNSNPENLTYGEILDKYDIDGIEYKKESYEVNGEIREDYFADFTPVAEAEVEIEGMTTDRYKNYAKAAEKLAEKWSVEGKDGKTDWSPRDVENWRREHNYTWHEHQDCKTVQLVPREVHCNTRHRGGVSILDERNKAIKGGV